MTNQVE